jgi:hypothetical protein
MAKNISHLHRDWVYRTSQNPLIFTGQLETDCRRTKKERQMKRLFAFLLLGIIAAPLPIAYCQQNVLIIARRGGESLDSFLVVEIPMMTKMLTESGYNYRVASDKLDTIKGYLGALPVDLLTSEVKLQDYCGVLIPCLGSNKAPEDAVEIVRKAILLSMPVASADGGIFVLSKAGALTNRRYAATQDYVKEYDQIGIYAGEGVVQDGMLITAGTCCLDTGKKDGTSELMELFVRSLKASE